MNFEKLTKSFWKLQITGWLVYLVLIYITFFSVAAEGRFLQLLRIKTHRTIIGFVPFDTQADDLPGTPGPDRLPSGEGLHLVQYLVGYPNGRPDWYDRVAATGALSAGSIRSANGILWTDEASLPAAEAEHRRCCDGDPLPA